MVIWICRLCRLRRLRKIGFPRLPLRHFVFSMENLGIRIWLLGIHQSSVYCKLWIFSRSCRGETLDGNLSTSLPCLSTKNFSKFHLMSPEFPFKNWNMGCAFGPFTSTLSILQKVRSGNVTYMMNEGWLSRLYLLINCLISSFVPGSCLPNWLHGKTTIFAISKMSKTTKCLVYFFGQVLTILCSWNLCILLRMRNGLHAKKSYHTCLLRWRLRWVSLWVWRNRILFCWYLELWNRKGMTFLMWTNQKRGSSYKILQVAKFIKHVFDIVYCMNITDLLEKYSQKLV